MNLQLQAQWIGGGIDNGAQRINSGTVCAGDVRQAMDGSGT